MNRTVKKLIKKEEVDLIEQAAKHKEQTKLNFGEEE